MKYSLIQSQGSRIIGKLFQFKEGLFELENKTLYKFIDGDNVFEIFHYNNNVFSSSNNLESLTEETKEELLCDYQHK